MTDSPYKEMNDPYKSSLQRSESTSKSITSWLMICLLHSLIGVFIMGYNLSLFNIPEDTIRANAAQSFINEYLWEFVNAMFPIGALFGAAFSGKISDKFGRRKVMIAGAIINIVSSLITATSYHYTQLLIGRFITGIAAGAATVVCSAYINEIAPDNLRGAMGASLQLTITIAIVVSELFGKIWLKDPLWRYGCAVGAFLCAIQLSLICTLLESPKWLMAQNRRHEAIQVLRKLRGIDYTSQSVSIPLKPLSTNTNDTTSHAMDDDFDQLLLASDDVDPEEVSLWKGIRKYPVIKRIFCISLFLHALQQLSGINVVFYYSTSILHSAGFENVWLGSVLLAGANAVSVIIVTPLVDKWGRKKLLLLSSIGMAMSAVAITVTFMGLHDSVGGKSEDDWGGAMVFCMVCYVVCFEMGLGPIPFVIVAELTPIEYRGAMISASQVVNYGCNTLIAATSVSLLNGLGVYGFVPFGCVCGVGAFFVFYFVPETKRKTTKQIIDQLDPTYYATEE
eukprot:252562_1